jgi:AraC-like DNA-binding protein
MAGQYMLIFSPAETPSAGARKKTVTFTLRHPVEWLKPLVLSFPALSAFLEKVQAGVSCQLTATPGLADLKMIHIIRNLLSSRYDGKLQDIYYNLQVSTLLMIALIGLNGLDEKTDGQLALRPADIEKIEAGRRYLLRNMDHPPTLIRLAREIGLNDCKLKKAYKQLYGTTVFGDFLQARMDKARKLLEETDESIVGIAELAGYKNVSSFSVAFKKYFGCTPGAYRKWN